MKKLVLLFILFFAGLNSILSLYASGHFKKTFFVKEVNPIKDSTAAALPELLRLKAVRIDSMLTVLYKNNQFNGTVLFSEGGKVVYSKSFGWADFEHKDTLKVNTPMPIASITKQFTAMAIMMLKERGQLNYDDNINKYLPEVEQEGVTIRHLLTHTSGLDFNGPHNRVWKVFRFMSRNAKKEGEIKIIDKNALLKAYGKKIPKAEFVPPGTRYRYSNGGYTLLAAIIERVSGIPYWEFMQKFIFDPLQMENTFVLRPVVLNNKKIAFSYETSLFKGLKKVPPYYDKYKPAKYCVLLDGDKHIYSTAEDMFKWDQALYTDKLVLQKTIKDAFVPGRLNDGKQIKYGFGWDLFPDEDSMLVEHTGGIENYSSAIQRNMDKNNTIIILTNAHPYNLFLPWMGMNDAMENKSFSPDVFPKKSRSERRKFNISVLILVPHFQLIMFLFFEIL